MNLGPDRLIEDLRGLGHTVEKVAGNNETVFAVIPAYEIIAGKFAGRTIGLGIQSTPDFPNNVHAAIHVKAQPQLYEPAENIPQVRNVTLNSPLGNEWRYWSENFNWTEPKTARRLMSKINTIFQNA